MVSLRRQQRALTFIADQVSRQPHMDPLAFFPLLLNTIIKALGVSKTGLHLLDDEKGQLHLIEQMGDVTKEVWQIVALPDNPTPLGQSLHMSKVQCGAMNGLGNIMAAPIIGVELPLGTLSVCLPDGLDDNAAADWESFLLGLGYLAGIALEHTGLINELLNNIDVLQEMQRRDAERAHLLEYQNRFLESTNTSLQNLAITDPLTGVANRRRIMDALQQEINRSMRTKLPFCLCMADVDYFKRINDEFGHQTGDKALMLLAGWLKESVRQLDLVGRYGGEEFLIILNNCRLEDGHSVANKLRQLVEQKSVIEPFKERGGFRLSLGVAQHQPGMDAADLTALADKALYQAKAGGRNQVVAAPLNPNLPAL